MDAAPPLPQSSLRVSPDLLSILMQDSFEAAMERALEALASAAHAQAVALFLADGEGIRGEFWRPRPESIPQAISAAFRHAAETALRSAEQSGASEIQAMDTDSLRLRMATAQGSARAAFCYPAPTNGGPAADEDRITAALNLVAWRFATHQEAARASALKTQYTRWFNTLDEQLRVLDRERQKFAAIVHRADARVFVTDLSCSISWTNTVMGSPPFPETRSTWIGLSCRDVCSSFAGKADPTDCECPVAEALETNRVVHREFHQSESYGTRNLYLSALPIKGPDGRPHEAMVMIQDLSDLEILRRSESRYRLLFERSGKAIVVVEPGTRRILLANPMASRMTGYSSAELLQLGLEALHPEAEWLSLDGEYRNAFESGTLAAHESRVRTRDGKERYAVVSGTRYDLDGQQTMMLEFQDITETKQVAEALKEAEHRLRTVVASAPIVVFALDLQGNITLSEGRGLDALRRQPGEVVGRSVYELYRDVPEILDSVDRAMAGEEANAMVRLGDLAFETCYAPMKDSNGRITGVIGVATDVSARYRLEEQLRHSQRMEAIGRLAGGVAHDFNNLLAAILGHSEMLIARLERENPLRRKAEEIRKAAERGALFTRQLLAFSRKEVLAPVVLDLNAVLGGMDGMLRRLIGEDIDFSTIPAAGLALVKADSGQLEQVIMNLVVNARDAMPQGGRLVIEIACVVLDHVYAQKHAGVKPGPYVMISVSDTGCGMDAETLAHIFEPFFTTKMRGKGTGLGLATVYGIVEQCSGHLWVESEPDGGTTFRVYLPEVVPAPEIPAPAPAPTTGAAPTCPGAETVLLVEDEESVRGMIRDVLLDQGYTVLEAGDGSHALEVAFAHPGAIHLLITDVVMPHMGGGELGQRLAALRPSIRVLFISGYTDDAIVRHGVTERGTAFLQKPFSLEVFIRRVREVLDAPGQQAA